MSYEGARPHYPRSVDKQLRTKGPESQRAYQDRHNRRSIDGLPGVPQRVGS
jgi:hypothetical protein